MTRYNTGQTGEYLVAAELARRGYTVALPTGNAPSIDLLAYKDSTAFSVQVKAVSKGSHQFNLGKFVDVEFVEGGGQKVNGPLLNIDREIVLVLVFLGERAGQDEFIWTTVGELADLLASEHQKYLDRRRGRRPGKNPKSLHSALTKKTLLAELGRKSLIEALAAL